jgi:hypothetical protein
MGGLTPAAADGRAQPRPRVCARKSRFRLFWFSPIRPLLSHTVSRKSTVYAAYNYVGSYPPEKDTRIVSKISRLRKNVRFFKI